jgi:hypothetical protein
MDNTGQTLEAASTENIDKNFNIHLVKIPVSYIKNRID